MSLGIEPGQQCEDFHQQLDNKQKKDNSRKSTATFKLRRRTLFTSKAARQTQKESQEPPSYQSNIGLNLEPNMQAHKEQDLTILSNINEKACKDVRKDCEQHLQEPLTRPEIKTHSYDGENYKYHFLV